jgi:hypothetical protein
MEQLISVDVFDQLLIVTQFPFLYCCRYASILILSTLKEYNTLSIVDFPIDDMSNVLVNWDIAIQLGFTGLVTNFFEMPSSAKPVVESDVIIIIVNTKIDKNFLNTLSPHYFFSS